MSKPPEQHPSFRDEAEERDFWESHDSNGYVDWSKAERVRLPNLRPSPGPSSSISLPSPDSANFPAPKSGET